MVLLLIFKKIKEHNLTNLIAPANKLKFNVRENIQKEEIVLELMQIHNKQIDTTDGKITNVGILITQIKKKKKKKKKKKVKKEKYWRST